MKFDSGVTSYVKATAVVTNYFPVDKNGVADIRCEQCRFYRTASRKCSLNNEICEYPAKYVGSCCPLEVEKEKE